jgi:broad specificity phosphatase PhoE
VDSRLNEVRHPPDSIGNEVRSVRRAWVAGRLDERHNGWETPTVAAARFDAGIRDYASGNVVIASHGMVLTAWLVSIGTLAAGQPAALFWEELGFPDIVEVEL